MFRTLLRNFWDFLKKFLKNIFVSFWKDFLRKYSTDFLGFFWKILLKDFGNILLRNFFVFFLRNLLKDLLRDFLEIFLRDFTVYYSQFHLSHSWASIYPASRLQYSWFHYLGTDERTEGRKDTRILRIDILGCGYNWLHEVA